MKSTKPIVCVTVTLPNGSPVLYKRFRSLSGAKNSIRRIASYAYTGSHFTDGEYTFRIIRDNGKGRPSVEEHVAHLRREEATKVATNWTLHRCAWVPCIELEIRTEPSADEVDCVQQEINDAWFAFDRSTLTGPVSDA